jgi:hypothetical protein
MSLDKMRKSRCLMSSADHVTSDSIIAEGTNGSDSVPGVPTAAELAEVLREHGWSPIYAAYRRRYRDYWRICECPGKRGKRRHTTKCELPPRTDGVKGPNAITQGNGEGRSIQYNLTGSTSYSLSRQLSRRERNALPAYRW